MSLSCGHVINNRRSKAEIKRYSHHNRHIQVKNPTLILNVLKRFLESDRGRRRSRLFLVLIWLILLLLIVMMLMMKPQIRIGIQWRGTIQILANIDAGVCIYKWMRRISVIHALVGILEFSCRYRLAKEKWNLKQTY